MSDFGPNSAYINELYFDFLKNPNAFDETWRSFFSNYNPSAVEESADVALAALHATSGNGAAAAAANGTATSNGVHTPAPSNGTASNGPAPQPSSPPVQAASPSAPQPAAPAASANVPEGAKPIGGVALRIVQNMEASRELPTATSFREIPVKLLEENRTLINGYLKASDQGKLSFTHIIGWAIVKALKDYPNLNNGFALVGGKPYLLERSDVNLGLAIDLERPDGSRSLVVPSIKGANRMNFREFYDTYEGIVRKARAGKLGPDDFAGTTITLTNPGTIGTIASVPRLMAGQGTIIATGGINYPAAYQGMDAETLSMLGVSKVMQMTSTYDHRIIQGAESGMLLARIQAELMGEDGFYDEIFRHLNIPHRPLRWERDHNTSLLNPDRRDATIKQAKVLDMIDAYRSGGHRLAHLNPLAYEPSYHPDLDPATYGLTIWDLDRVFLTGGLGGKEELDLRTILGILRDTYTQRIGVEYTHIPERDRRGWLQERMETSRNAARLEAAQKGRILRKLSEAEGFERFLQTKYSNQKRFSLEGAETMIPMLDELVERSGDVGVKGIVIGMAHRGRLNVLTSILGKSPAKIFSEFEDSRDPESVLGSGDVKYHLGQVGKVTTANGATVSVELAPNPSHLEAVNPVIEGMVRSMQDRAGEGGERLYIPVQIHGDAAFMGQGVVAETLNMSQLPGYRTGGTLHIVVNNQIGFTTCPSDSRSSTYCTDVAKMVGAPIFHVNGDDPESAVYVTRLAFEYRQQFACDVVIDMICYRRYGHNEGDEPSYTQPLMYERIRSYPSVRRVYTERLVHNGTLTQEAVDATEQEFKSRLEEMLTVTKAGLSTRTVSDPLADQKINPETTWSNPQTGVPEFMLRHLIGATSAVPEGFTMHPKLAAMFERRAKTSENDGQIDWALAEALAFGSLLLEGHPIRLSGQDSQRGTFSHRHSVLHDQHNDARHTPLNNLSETQPRFMVYDSPLSEYAVLGFEYGYSVADPQTLVLWEAQFGDFVNGAQIIIDQFISSGEDKWGQTAGLCMLLPHGFEGQGPEHSSARMERFLTLSAEDNMRIVYPTTAAQYFHLLRLQAKREVRKPLIVMTPKSLLRDPLVSSNITEFVNGEFRKVIGEVDGLEPSGVRRLVLCTGKVYYDLLKARRKTGQTDVALVRIESLYPFPAAQVREELKRYSETQDVVWLQEEPKNMGAWGALSHWIREELGATQRLSFLGRPASGSPAAGSGRSHAGEQEEIVRRALNVAIASVPDTAG